VTPTSRIMTCAFLNSLVNYQRDEHVDIHNFRKFTPPVFSSLFVLCSPLITAFYTFHSLAQVSDGTSCPMTMKVGGGYNRNVWWQHVAILAVLENR
jgi:hypothetical protein